MWPGRVTPSPGVSPLNSAGGRASISTMVLSLPSLDAHPVGVHQDLRRGARVKRAAARGAAACVSTGRLSRAPPLDAAVQQRDVRLAQVVQREEGARRQQPAQVAVHHHGGVVGDADALEHLVQLLPRPAARWAPRRARRRWRTGPGTARRERAPHRTRRGRGPRAAPRCAGRSAAGCSISPVTSMVVSHCGRGLLLGMLTRHPAVAVRRAAPDSTGRSLRMGGSSRVVDRWICRLLTVTLRPSQRKAGAGPNGHGSQLLRKVRAGAPSARPRLAPPPKHPWGRLNCERASAEQERRGPSLTTTEAGPRLQRSVPPYDTRRSRHPMFEWVQAGE